MVPQLSQARFYLQFPRPTTYVQLFMFAHSPAKYFAIIVAEFRSYQDSIICANIVAVYFSDKCANKDSNNIRTNLVSFKSSVLISILVSLTLILSISILPFFVCTVVVQLNIDDPIQSCPDLFLLYLVMIDHSRTRSDNPLCK